MTDELLRRIILTDTGFSKLDATRAGDLVDMLEFVPIDKESHCGQIMCHLSTGESFLLSVGLLKKVMEILDERCSTSFVKISRKKAVNQNNMLCYVNKVIVMKSGRKILLEKWQSI